MILLVVAMLAAPVAGQPLPSTPAQAAPSAAVEALTARFLQRYFAQHPTRATEAGDGGFDLQLEDPSPERLDGWLDFCAAADGEAAALQAQAGLSSDDAIDLEVLRNAVARERFELRVRRAPARDPLFWTTILSNAGIYLALREDQPLEARVAALAARAGGIPRLVAQAKAALGATAPEEIARERTQPAARQAEELSRLYGKGLGELAATAPAQARAALAATAPAAAAALGDLAAFLKDLAARASGSPRLGPDYAEAFRLGLQQTETPAQLLPRFEEDLARLRRDGAALGRKLWPALVPGVPAPAGDKALLRHLFAAIEEQHDTEVAAYTSFWQGLVPELEKLVRARSVITLPEPRTLRISPAPAYLAGQSYGGVFPAGPFRPDGDTLLLLPVPGADASPEDRATFFRAFNRPFSRMIAAHEALPGHYVQLKIAAHQPHKLRALLPDQVYVEGWGTFVEELMLDEGWGGPAERVAHLKKQLENCARAIVDIRVHTTAVSRDEVIRFVREEALQDPQLAENLWQRTLTSAPQIVAYHLGFRRIDALYRSARRRKGFSLRGFSDQLMSLGPVPLRHYERLLSAGAHKPG